MPLAYVKGSFCMLMPCIYLHKTWNWCVKHCEHLQSLHGVPVDVRGYFWQMFFSPWQRAISRAEYSMGACRNLTDIIEELREVQP